MSKRVHKVETTWEGESDIVHNLEERGLYTPDYYALLKWNYLAVFVYDNLKRDYDHKQLLKNGLYLGRGRTVSNSYVMKGNNLPIVMEAPNGGIHGAITGECYAIRPQDIFAIDHHYKNGDRFKRAPRSITLVDQEYKTSDGMKRPIIQCLMYLGVKKHWDTFAGLLPRPLVSSGPDNAMGFTWALGSYKSQKVVPQEQPKDWIAQYLLDKEAKKKAKERERQAELSHQQIREMDEWDFGYGHYSAYQNGFPVN